MINKEVILNCFLFMKIHDEDMWLLDEEYIWGYIINALNFQIGVSIHSIERSIGVQKSEIDLSYKGGWEALEQATGLQGGHNLLPVAASEYGAEASFQ